MFEGTIQFRLQVRQQREAGTRCLVAHGTLVHVDPAVGHTDRLHLQPAAVSWPGLAAEGSSLTVEHDQNVETLAALHTLMEE